MFAPFIYSFINDSLQQPLHQFGTSDLRLIVAALFLDLLSPVHISDDVAKNGDIVAETSDIAETGDIVAKNRDVVAKTGNIVAKNTMSPVSATLSPFFGDIVAGVDGTLVNEIQIWSVKRPHMTR